MKITSLLILSLILSLIGGCKKKLSKKPSEKLSKSAIKPANKPEQFMSIADPGKKKKLPRRKPSPRMKTKKFKLVNATAKKLPTMGYTPKLVVVSNFSGDKKQEFAYLSFNKLQFVNLKGKIIAETTGHAVPRIAIPLKGKKTSGLLVVWGRGRKSRKAGINLVLYNLKNNKIEEKVLFSPKSSRPDPQDLYIDKKGTIFLAWFTSKYQVTVSKLPFPYKKVENIDTIKMVSKLNTINYKGKISLVMGRLYGDTSGSDGDLFIHLSKKQRLPLPTKRGIRSMIQGDLDGIKGTELYVGDGWHKNYGQIARAYLTQITIVNNKPQTKLIDTLPNNYSILHLALGDLDGDGKFEIIGKGNNSIVAWFPSKKWKRVTLASVSSYSNFTAADVDGDGKWEIIITSPYAQMLNYRKK
jgi:hypothetical protein